MCRRRERRAGQWPAAGQRSCRPPGKGLVFVRSSGSFLILTLHLIRRPAARQAALQGQRRSQVELRVDATGVMMKRRTGESQSQRSLSKGRVYFAGGLKQRAKYATLATSAQLNGQVTAPGCSTGVQDGKQRSKKGSNEGTFSLGTFFTTLHATWG